MEAVKRASISISSPATELQTIRHNPSQFTEQRIRTTEAKARKMRSEDEEGGHFSLKMPSSFGAILHFMVQIQFLGAENGLVYIRSEFHNFSLSHTINCPKS